MTEPIRKRVVLWDEMDASFIPQRARFGLTIRGEADRLTRTIPAVEPPSLEFLKALAHYTGADFAAMPCLACGRMVPARFEALGVVTYETCCN